MPRNKSEKWPGVLAEREVTPKHCGPELLVMKVGEDGRYSVTIGTGRDMTSVMTTYGQHEARRMYDWFHKDFYYASIPGWGTSRWTSVDAS